MHQKDIFLESEADAWFERNHRAINERDFATEDSVTQAIAVIIRLPQYVERGRIKILEVGCGEGCRLEWIARNLNADVFGIEPSAKAVGEAAGRGIKAQRGTADKLPYEDGVFDILIYGFCLYLCDREDLFRIASEANRVLKPDSWIVINDFFAPTPIKRGYRHRLGVYSYKMDYRKLFDWHPAFTCYAHRLSRHGLDSFTDDPQEWVATSVMRKNAGLEDE